MGFVEKIPGESSSPIHTKSRPCFGTRAEKWTIWTLQSRELQLALAPIYLGHPSQTEENIQVC